MIGRAIRPARMLAVLGVMLCGSALAAQSSRDADQIENPEVTSLRFQGVHAVDRGELLASIKTDQSSCNSLLVKVLCLFTKSHYFYTRRYLDRKEFARDVIRIRAFYWKRGYRETMVDTLISGKDRVSVRFFVKEGPPTIVTRISVERPEKLLSERDVRRLVLLRTGKAFDQLALDSSIVRLRLKLWDRGYADAEVTAESISVDPKARTAQLRIGIDPKWATTIGAVRIRGNHEVTEKTVRSSLYFKTGDLFRRDYLIQSQRRLYQTNMFKRAAIVFPPEGDSVKTIEVTVQEAPLRDVRTSVGFNTYEFFQIDGRYTRYNFFGAGRRLNVNGAIGNIGAQQLNGRAIFRDVFRNYNGDRTDYYRPNWLASADVQQPAFFFSPRNSGGVGIFAHRRSAPGIYVDNGYGSSATFTRELSPRAPLSGTYRFEVTRVTAAEVYFCVNYGVCEDTTISALKARQRLSPVGLALSIDQSNDLLNPRNGYVGRAEVEHASSFTASDFRYNRATAEAAAYRPIGKKATLAGHARIGWVRALKSTDIAGDLPIIHPRKRFYAGGAQSVRGYGENQLGPRILTIAPEVLRGRTIKNGVTTYSRCDISVPIKDCNPNDVTLADRYFEPRPTGGNTVFEGSAELRFPIWRQLGGAAFIDGGIVGQSQLKNLASGNGAITPGFGIRYYSPVGPIRVDVGFNPLLRETYTVITQDDADPNGGGIARLTTKRNKYPRVVATSIGGRLRQSATLHLSIGQAY